MWKGCLAPIMGDRGQLGNCPQSSQGTLRPLVSSLWREKQWGSGSGLADLVAEEAEWWMRYPGRALDLHSCRYFHSPSSVKVIYVFAVRRKPLCGCPRIGSGLLHIEIPQKALRPRKPQSLCLPLRDGCVVFPWSHVTQGYIYFWGCSLSQHMCLGKDIPECLRHWDMFLSNRNDSLYSF